jgi:hypothetical protein
MFVPRSFRWPLGVLAAGLIGVPVAHLTTAPVHGQGSAKPVVRLTAEEDHKRTLHLLGIEELRPGRNGLNKEDPRFANYDEAKANPFPDLPDPLKLKSGSAVTRPAAWWNTRRPEIVEDFDREVYGRVPKETPAVRWEVASSTPGKNGDVDIVTRQLVGVVDNRAYPDIEVRIALTLVTPAGAKGPVPVVMQFGGPRPAAPTADAAAPAPPVPPYGPNAFTPPFRMPAAPVGRGAAAGGALRPPAAPAGPTWQQQVLARGWGYAQLDPSSIQADNGAGLTLGIIGLVNRGQPRQVDDWGALRAWAWGVRRALDYFETDKSVDAKHVALEGHSRYGKATLVAMAYEPRLWTAYVSSSGEGGAKLHRRDWGEIVENVAGAGEYHWMAGNFLKYAGPLHWNDLPVDSHELIAMCAPRPVFLSAGRGGYDAEPGGDSWVDAKGTFLAGQAAGPVYRLLGKKEMPGGQFPPIETLVGEHADVSFRQHGGGHTDAPNWPFFLDFAARHLK